MKIHNLTFDCVDPDRQATFWAAALGYSKGVLPEDMRRMLLDSGLTADDLTARALAEDPAGVGPRLFFHRVPEGKFGESRTTRSALSCTNRS
jgi:hypothetical protein